jgi:DNA-binding MarR family transcriptional regulator
MCVSLTAKGRRLYDKIVPLANAFQADLLNTLKSGQPANLQDALMRMRQLLDRRPRP